MHLIAVASNDPNEFTELVNPFSGQTVVYHSDRFGQRCWRPKYPEEIERFLALDMVDNFNRLRNEDLRYPFVKEVAFCSIREARLSPAEREQYLIEYRLWHFEHQISGVLEHFFRFRGGCPRCNKYWSSGTGSKIICLCGCTFELIDEGGLRLMYDEQHQKRAKEIDALYTRPDDDDDFDQDDESDGIDYFDDLDLY
jgi:hypothetical protein